MVSTRYESIVPKSRDRKEQTKRITNIPNSWFTDHKVEFFKKQNQLKNAKRFNNLPNLDYNVLNVLMDD